MKRSSGFALVCLIGCVLFGWWFWSLGDVPQKTTPRIELRVDGAPVQVKRNGSTVWMDIATSTLLAAGDVIQTGEAGSASIVFFDRAVSRIGQQTQIVLAVPQAPRDEFEPLMVDMKLVSGRIWSRVLRLVDLDSLFQVQTDAVVATVRGTAFDLNTSATSTTVWVSDSAVQLFPAGQAQTRVVEGREMLGEGHMSQFDARGKLLRTQVIGDAALQSPWFTENTRRDQEFLAHTSSDLLTRVRQFSHGQMGGLSDGLRIASEHLRLYLFPSERMHYRASYVKRRLVGVLDLMREGKSGLAFQLLAGVHEELVEQDTKPDPETLRSIRGVVWQALFLMHDTTPSSPEYRLKQQLENLALELDAKDAALLAFTRLLIIDARLDEVVLSRQDASSTHMQTLLDTAHEGIGNVERDIEHLPETVSVDRMDVLRGKLASVKAREAVLK